MPINLSSIVSTDVVIAANPDVLTAAQRLIDSSAILQKQLSEAIAGNGLEFTYSATGGTGYTPSTSGGPKQIQLGTSALSSAENLVGLIAHEIAHVQDTNAINRVIASTASSGDLTANNAAVLLALMPN